LATQGRVLVECEICKGYGLIPAEIAYGVVCARCGGAGGHEHAFTPFSGIKKYPGIKRVRRSGGRDPMALVDSTEAIGIPYGDFVKGKRP
jgi:hypothetical protein